MKRYAAGLATALLIAGCQQDATGPTPVPDLTIRAKGSNGRIPFETYGCDFALSPGKVWQTGDILHIRGQSSHGLHLSTNELVSGSIRLFAVNADINLVTGEGTFSGNLVLTPTKFEGDGSWRAHFKGFLPGVPGGPFIGDPPTQILSHMVAHGTGALGGRTLEFDHTVNMAFAIPPEITFPEGCEWTGELFKGFIFSKRR